MPIKLILLGGVVGFLEGGGGSANFVFMGVGIFPKFALLKFYRHGVSEERQRFWTISSLPPMPPPLENPNFVSVVVSPSLS